MLQTSLLLMKSLNKTEAPIFYYLLFISKDNLLDFIKRYSIFKLIKILNDPKGKKCIICTMVKYRDAFYCRHKAFNISCSDIHVQIVHIYGQFVILHR